MNSCEFSLSFCALLWLWLRKEADIRLSCSLNDSLVEDDDAIGGIIEVELNEGKDEGKHSLGWHMPLFSWSLPWVASGCCCFGCASESALLARSVMLWKLMRLVAGFGLPCSRTWLVVAVVAYVVDELERKLETECWEWLLVADLFGVDWNWSDVGCAKAPASWSRLFLRTRWSPASEPVPVNGDDWRPGTPSIAELFVIDELSLLCA